MSGTLYWKDRNSIHAIGKLLAEGCLVAGTTDTVIGLFSSANQKGRSLLDDAKIRNEKPYLILADNVKRVLDYLHSDQKKLIEDIAALCWPGPVTLIAKAAANAPTYFVSAENTIAFRVPAHAGMQELLKESGLLFSTSANISGETIPKSVHEITPSISALVAAVIEDDQSRESDARPSTILDCSKDQITVVRKGDFDLELLNPILGYTPR